VARAACPVQLTVAPDTKDDPVSVIVNEGPPALAEFGLIEVRTGAASALIATSAKSNVAAANHRARATRSFGVNTALSSRTAPSVSENNPFNEL